MIGLLQHEGHSIGIRYSSGANTCASLPTDMLQSRVTDGVMAQVQAHHQRETHPACAVPRESHLGHAPLVHPAIHAIQQYQHLPTFDNAITNHVAVEQTQVWWADVFLQLHGDFTQVMRGLCLVYAVHGVQNAGRKGKEEVQCGSGGVVTQQDAGDGGRWILLPTPTR